MNEHPILAQVVLGSRLLFDRHRAPMATRLTVFPARPDAAPDAAALLHALGEVWPEAGGQRVVLNLAGEALLLGALEAPLPKPAIVEVPAFIAADARQARLLQAQHARGGTLLLKGSGAGALPDPVLGCFDYVLVEPGEIAPLAAPRPMGLVQSGVHTPAEADEAYARGASAVIGWPTEVPATGGTTRPSPPDLQVIVELMKRVDREEPVDRLEAVLKNDASLAFRLVRYINSAAFGLRVEISSFRHAIMMLGYQKLKRWLALLLASAGRDPNLKPVLALAVRRGLFMEELVRASGDEQQRSEMFICGVFSLLDCLLAQPLEQLMNSIPVPQDVADALAHGSGPYRAYLDVVRAVEQESLFDIREASETLLLSSAEVNRALLRALAAAQQVD